MTCSMIQINLFFFLSTLNYNLQLSNSQKVNNVQHYNKRSTKQINYRNTWLCICSEIRSLMLKVGNLTKKSQLFLSLKKKIPPFFLVQTQTKRLEPEIDTQLSETPNAFIYHIHCQQINSSQSFPVHKLHNTTIQHQQHSKRPKTLTANPHNYQNITKTFAITNPITQIRFHRENQNAKPVKSSKPQISAPKVEETPR